MTNNDKKLVDQKIYEQDVSVYAYDKAIVSDFRARFKQPEGQVNNTVQIGPADQMFNIIGSMNQDNIVMPFISLQRLGWELEDRQGQQTFVGKRVVNKEDQSGNLIEVNAQVLPITIRYQLSVWSTNRITNDAIIRELLFYYHLKPSLIVKIGHGLNIVHKFNLYFDPGIEDNSDIANHINKGTYFRQDLTFSAEDCYLWRANYQQLVNIDTNLQFNYGIANDEK